MRGGETEKLGAWRWKLYLECGVSDDEDRCSLEYDYRSSKVKNIMV